MRSSSHELAAVASATSDGSMPLASIVLGNRTGYAASLGLAFQIADDILDVTGDETRTGKRLHKDAEAGKALRSPKQ